MVVQAVVNELFLARVSGHINLISLAVHELIVPVSVRSSEQTDGVNHEVFLLALRETDVKVKVARPQFSGPVSLDENMDGGSLSSSVILYSKTKIQLLMIRNVTGSPASP